MKSLNTKLIIDGIRSQDKIVLKNIYTDYFPTIKRFVIENSGTAQDAKDVFQEGIIIIYRKIKEGNFELSSSFKTYIYSVCQYIWIKQLSRTKENVEKLNNYLEYEGVPEISEDEYRKNEQFKLYQKHFKRLNKDCQKLLQLFLKKVPLKDIAKELGIENEQYIKQRKYKCKEQLIKYIKSDPNYLNRDEEET